MARNWEGLSPAYQRRLERRGITPDAYRSGVNLQEARGHVGDERPQEDGLPSKRILRAWYDRGRARGLATSAWTNALAGITDGDSTWQDVRGGIIGKEVAHAQWMKQGAPSGSTRRIQRQLNKYTDPTYDLGLRDLSEMYGDSWLYYH